MFIIAPLDLLIWILFIFVGFFILILLPWWVWLALTLLVLGAIVNRRKGGDPTNE